MTTPISFGHLLETAVGPTYLRTTYEDVTKYERHAGVTCYRIHMRQPEGVEPETFARSLAATLGSRAEVHNRWADGCWRVEVPAPIAR